jgi:pheromone shutdown protein TraB
MKADKKRAYMLLMKHVTWLVYAETLVLLGVKIAQREWTSALLASVIVTVITTLIVDSEARGFWI